MSENKHTFPELESLFTDAESCDSAIFSEMRSNLLLIDGEHYSRRQSNFYARIRDSKELNDKQKIRLTKNHTKKIINTYSSTIVSLAPGVGFMPANETELRDQKVAELHSKLWSYAKEKLDMDSLVEDWVDDNCGLGEMAAKIFWDPNEGQLVAYKQEVGDDDEPQFNEDGSPTPGEPVYSGGFVVETIHAFNLLRDPNCKDIRKSPVLIIRKMVDKEKLMHQFGENEEKERYIVEGHDETMVVFDSDKNNYKRAQNEVFVREFYFRPCHKYPRGYFYITTKAGILSEGELPGGIFPIAVGIMEKIQTSARGRSPVKTIRPYQAEINRMGSKIAEHQVSMGDDKIITQAGTKISQGVALSGIRHITTTGSEPVILEGRDGSQYFTHAANTITELYQLMDVNEAPDEAGGQTDPYAMLFKSARQKKKFSRYVRRVERFLIEVARIYMELAKVHMPDEMLIEALGKDEQVNLEEFRDMGELCYKIHIDPKADDIETVFGKQLVLNQILQYAGSQLSPEDIGTVIEAMPYGNSKMVTSDLTLNRRAATNDILALDRGKTPPIHEYDDHKYFIKRLVSRMREPDFEMMSPDIKQNYAANVHIRQQIEAEQIKQLQAMESEMIPTTGYLVVCDLYVPKPSDPTKTQRVQIPSSSLTWLIDKLKLQGNSLDQLHAMNQGALTQMVDMLQEKQGMDMEHGGPMMADQQNQSPQHDMNQMHQIQHQAQMQAEQQQQGE